MKNRPPVRYRIRPTDPAAHLFEVACTVADPDPAGPALRAAGVDPGQLPDPRLRAARRRDPRRARGAAVALDQARQAHLARGACARPAHGDRRGVRVGPVGARRASRHDARLLQRHVRVPAGARAGGARRARSRSCRPRGAPLSRAGAWRRRCARNGRAAVRLRRLRRGRLRRADRSSGRDGRVRARDVHAPAACRTRSRSPGGSSADLDAPRARSEAPVRMAHPVLRRPGADGSLRVPGDRGRRGLRRARAPRLDRARCAPRRPAAARREGGRPRATAPSSASRSHEYFHTWNVKRIKPAAFTPYDLDRENYTTLLWAFEGITSYYDDLALVRCGLIDARATISRRSAARSPSSCARRGGAGRRSPSRAGTPGSSTTGRTRTAQRDRQLLRQGQPGRAVPRSAHPQPHRRPQVARRRDARAVAALRADRASACRRTASSASPRR